MERIIAEKVALPDGAPGAKWGGLVFPIHDGKRIETTDAGVLPFHCRPWVEPKPNWRFELCLASEGYLFFSGGDRRRVQVLRELSGAGITVLRSGSNLSGSEEDWFARIATVGASIEEQLTSALGSIPPETSADQNQGLRERLLAEALVAALSARDRLQSELGRLTTTDAQAAEAAAAEAQATIDTLQSNLATLTARLSELEAEAAAGLKTSAAHRSEARTTSLRNVVEEAATHLLPRLEFSRDSLQFVSVEIGNRSGLWRILADLDRQERGQPVGWKSLAGHPGWWERHFSNGQDDQGRVYAKLKQSRSGWDVLVSHKQSQARDLRYLE